MPEASIFTTAIVSPKEARLPEVRRWEGLEPLSELITDLTHLPMTKTMKNQQITVPFESGIARYSAFTVTTTYFSGNHRLGIDGEVLNAMILSTLQDRKGIEGDRVYLDDLLESLLGELEFTNNTNLPYVLKRLEETTHQIKIWSTYSNGECFPFTAGKFVQGLGVPYFEWSAEMIEAIFELEDSTTFSAFNLGYHATLKHPGARRLYRHICRKGGEDLSVSELARILGIYTAPDRSDNSLKMAKIPRWGQLHRAFDRALLELVERGFLRQIVYTGTGNQRNVHFDIDTRFF